ncbi:MAG: hypothetical protein HY201_01010 [Nitrospirae bacterium]|nr:hypothetical protein [Candidatus Troglogloeales bacterium]MBI3598030.1 hypothetical protein [Candidatus Troglogloeales bacterium]
MITLLPRLDVEQLQETTLYFLAENPATDGTVLDLMAKYFLTTEKLLQKIVQHPHVEKTTLNFIRLFVSPSSLAFLGFPEQTHVLLEPALQEMEQKRVTAIGGLRVPEKIQLALKGNKEARTLLLRDPNRQVFMAVLESPRLTDEEVDNLAQSKNTSEEILRAMARNPAWVRRHSVTEALVNNPKTPLSVSLGFLKTLRVKDLERLSKNKGIPAALRTTAFKMVLKKGAKTA